MIDKKTWVIAVPLALLIILGDSVAMASDPLSKLQALTNSSSARMRDQAHVESAQTNVLNIVSGGVAQANGRPVAGVEVQAINKGYGSEKALGQATTQSDGKYSISYRRDGAPVNLMVLVLDKRKGQIGQSAVRTGAGHVATIDIVVP